MSTAGIRKLVFAVGVVFVCAAVLIVAVQFLAPSLASRSVYGFSKYGFWGMSPAKLAVRCEKSKEINEIIACFDAISRSNVHYSGANFWQPRQRLAYFESIYGKADEIWGDVKVNEKVWYGGYIVCTENVKSVRLADFVKSIAVETVFREFDRSSDLEFKDQCKEFIIFESRRSPPSINDEFEFCMRRFQLRENAPIFDE